MLAERNESHLIKFQLLHEPMIDDFFLTQTEGLTAIEEAAIGYHKGIY